MIDFLMSPLSDTAAVRPAVLWILGITLAAIASVLLRDAWRWFIALGKPEEPLAEAEDDGGQDSEVDVADTIGPKTAVPYDRRSPINTSTGFGRRRTDRVGLAQSAG